MRRILDDAPNRLSPKGSLIVEIGNGQKALEASRPDVPFMWLDTEASRGEVFAVLANDLKPARTGNATGGRKQQSRPDR